MAAHETLKHLLISASAGSGKTYQLTRRYVHLLALGEEAPGIAAMTFTRKAAGEFFSRILGRLAALAETPKEAETFFAGCEPAPPAGLDCPALLRRVTRRMHRLRLGTMDSFFAAVTSCFPLELGLPAGARVMDEEEGRQARAEVLEALLERLHAEEDSTSLRLLMEAYKQATFGSGERSVDATLQGWAADGLSLWEDALEPGTATRGWGEIRAIWPGGLPDASSLTAAIDQVRRDFVPPHEPGKELLEDVLAEASLTIPGQPLPKRVAELMKKLGEIWPALSAGGGELMWMRKKLPLQPPAARALKGLVERLLAREFLVRAERTRGMAAVVAMFAGEYASRVRGRGRLSFADVQRLLAQAAREKSPWLGEEGDLWFRLDGRTRHWLLDEFQDTSRGQWQVISGLVDEVIQDNDDGRSFFAVGDPKQSIYLWRQAEPDLFDDILKAYPASGAQGLHQQPLSVSYRSAPAVLDAVNAVFGDARLLQENLPAGSLKGFAFQAHQAAKKDLSGYACLLSPTVTGADDEEEPEPAAVAAALLKEIRPLERGLTCAVLVRQNKEAREVTETLKELTGMEVVCESEQHPCTDNATTLALMSLLTLAAHPGDGQAMEHLKMTPLWQVFCHDEGYWRRTLVDVQRQVLASGFAPFMEAWAALLLAGPAKGDGFAALRLRQMADIAAEFDATGERDVDSFLDFARNYPLRTRGSAGAIQVMTVHASKGLEFDVVILPSLDGDDMADVRRSDLLIRRDTEGVRWVLQSPPTAYARLDPVLGAQLEEARRRAAFESLCRLYVAMTRAKRGLYMIAKIPPKTAKAVKESKLLRTMLGVTKDDIVQTPGWVVEWETGDAAWHESAQGKTEPSAEEPPYQGPALGELLRARQPLSRRRTPSGEESFAMEGKVLFGDGRDPGRRLGSLVHEMLACVAWLTPQAPWLAEWAEKGLLEQDSTGQARAMVEGVLAHPDCAPVFEATSDAIELWRERPFDLVLGDEWLSGIFDRVLLMKNPDGRPARAWIVDFKTDQTNDDAALAEKVEGYRPQIRLYRDALCQLTGLKPAQVRASLLFTRKGRLVEL